jgi:hypothetical protein
MNRFKQTEIEIKAAYSPIYTARPIFFEYSSQYRRIVVLGDTNYPNGGFEIRIEYKGFAKEFNKTWSIRWKQKIDALAWAKCYAENREIICGNLTIKERIGSQLI